MGQTDIRAAVTLASDLEEQIAMGVLQEGTMLPSERELMERYGASRTVVREAIAALAGLGLIEHRPRYRPVVRKPGYDAAMDVLGGVARHLLQSKQGVGNLFELRVFLEAGLVREAALRANREQIAQLREALMLNGSCIDDPVAFDESDIAFHAVFYSIPGNPIYPALHRTFTAWLAKHWLEMERSVGLNRTNYDLHVAIFDAVLARDADRAEELMRSHLDLSWRNVQGTFTF